MKDRNAADECAAMSVPALLCASTRQSGARGGRSRPRRRLSFAVWAGLSIKDGRILGVSGTARCVNTKRSLSTFNRVSGRTACRILPSRSFADRTAPHKQRRLYENPHSIQRALRQGARQRRFEEAMSMSPTPMVEVRPSVALRPSPTTARSIGGVLIRLPGSPWATGCRSRKPKESVTAYGVRFEKAL